MNTLSTRFNKKFLVAIALIASAPMVHGQGAVSAATEIFSPRRIVKTNLAGYALLVVNANYEEKLGGHTSAGLMGGYKLPSVIHVDAIGEMDGENQTYSGDIEPQGLFLNPYFRYYTNKTFKGFYVEGFGRYYDYTFLVPYEYDKNGAIINANLDGTASGFGGGLALGAQVELGTRVYLDINLGYGMGSGDVHVDTNDPNLDAADYQSIKRNIEQHAEEADIQIFVLDNVLKGVEADANSSSAWADIDGGIFPIFRGGISIGFAF